MALGIFQKGRFALDLGGSSLVVVGVSGRAGNLKLHTCFEWPLSPGLVTDGEVSDTDLVGRQLKTMVAERKIRGKAVHLAVSNQKVIVRNIDMPEMTEEELIGAVQFQAQEYIPIPVEEVVLDSQVTGKRVAADGTTRQEVLLVAAQKTMIGTLSAAVRHAGLRVAGIDVSSLALVRALIPETPFLAEAGGMSTSRGIADISSSVSTLVVAVDGVMRFTRVINFSSDRFARALTEARGIPFEDSQTMVQRVGLPGPLPPDAEYYADDVILETQGFLGKVAGELADEIRRSFDYYHGQDRAVAVTELILSGRGALLRNLDSYLADRLGMPVVIGNPLHHISRNASGLPDLELAAMAPCLSVAIGLALPEDD